jgi:molybdopterin/thiamine biosynthesis adenylyltransferase
MDIDRYRRQTLVQQFGQKGQETLAEKQVVVIGAGGLGSYSTNLLVRMGIGKVDIIDNDVVDITNLHRTSVFTEADIGKSKAIILQEKLRASNTDSQIKGIKQKVTTENIKSFVNHADVIIDGTDNLSLRFLINQVSITQMIPWVYAGVHGTIGMVMGILPKKTPCLHCISQNITQTLTGETPVFGSLPATIASIQTTETIKLLLGKPLAGLIIYDIWEQYFDRINLKRNINCLVCGKKKTAVSEKVPK